MYNPSNDEIKKASGVYEGFGFEDKVVRKVVEEPCTETLHKMVDHAANPPMLESEWSNEVNTPAHYVKDGIECIDAIKGSMTVEEFKGYLKGNVMKYMWRYQDKEKSAICTGCGTSEPPYPTKPVPAPYSPHTVLFKYTV